MSVNGWLEKYASGIPLVVLTAYDAQFSNLISATKIDGILVGDSLRHTFFGDSTTVTMTMDHMIYHTTAVVNGAPDDFIIADMPFMSYSISIEETLRHATSLVQAGATAIKCEVRESHIPTIERLIQEGFQVMAHIGLQPQYIHESGGYTVKGSSKDEQTKLLNLAKTLSNTGVFSIVLEKVPINVSKTITDTVSCPTIGIGAGPHCSGQILVTNDLLGLTPNFNPKFVKKYCNGWDQFSSAIESFKQDVRAKEFPSNDHGYNE